MNEDLNNQLHNHEITVTANGENHAVPYGKLLPDFLRERNLSLDRVVVERNGMPLAPSEARKVTLQDGDRLEVVKIVAGG